MEEKIVVELRNGERFDAVWAQPFVPSNKEIVILLADSKEKRRFSLSRISCILMSELLEPNMKPKKEAPLEEIECLTGTKFQVRCLDTHQLQEGFFAIPDGKSSSYKLIFFTDGSVRSRTSHTPVGEILRKQGAISEKDLNNTLKEQKRLRERRLGEIISQENKLEQDIIDQFITSAQAKNKTGKWPRVGDILVDAGMVKREQVESALATQGTGKKKRIGRLLIERGLVTEEQVLSALATKFNLPFVDLDQITIDPKALTSISAELAMQLQVFPIYDDGNCLHFATGQPTDHTTSDSLRFHTNRRIKMHTASPAQIREHIKQHYSVLKDFDSLLLDNIEEDELVLDEDEDDTVSESDSETIRLANRILIDAYQQGASDIHLEPGGPRQPVGVRYRVDGICKIIKMLPSRFAKPLIARIKVMANLDIAEHRKAQSGKILIRFQGKKIEYRIEITPTVGGKEDAVLRILSSSKPIPMDQMGLSEANLAIMKDLITKPYGIILCVGPTGSGKTTTLHAALGYINKPEKKIWTVEDPVEITQAGLRQVEVKEQIGFTFQVALRSLLRADPDVVMIGEMRDQEAAHTAIEASLTGHLVFSTLHTNSAPETITRLIEMGEDPFNLADALLGIIAQRLTRKLCDSCKETYNLTKEEYDELSTFYGKELFKEHGHPEYSDDITAMRKRGCEKCGSSGYKGRIAIHELLLCTDRVRSTIKQNLPITEIQKAAIEDGMHTLRMDGVEKVLLGLTDLENIQRVCL